MVVRWVEADILRSDSPLAEIESDEDDNDSDGTIALSSATTHRPDAGFVCWCVVGEEWFDYIYPEVGKTPPKVRAYSHRCNRGEVSLVDDIARVTDGAESPQDQRAGSLTAASSELARCVVHFRTERVGA